MSTTVMSGAWLWKRATSNEMDAYVGPVDEPVIDYRKAAPALRIMDGVTPGGNVVKTGLTFGVGAPKIILPIYNDTGVNIKPYIKASNFMGITIDGQADTHVASFWEFASDAAFTDIVMSTGRVTDALTVLDLETFAGGINSGFYNYQYHLRVKYEGAVGGEGAWSSTHVFTTEQLYPTTIDAKLTADDGMDNARLGLAVAISGDGKTIVGGAYLDSELVTSGGAAYVWTLENGVWVQQQKLHDSLALEGTTQYGRSVAINTDGSLIAIGSNQNNNNDGAAYIFKLTNGVYVEEVVLFPPNPDPLDTWIGYGTSLKFANGGDTLLVSSYGHGIGALQHGAVYLYSRAVSAEGVVTWSNDHMFEPGTPTVNENFGFGMDINSDATVVVIGAHQDTGIGVMAGAAYIFTKTAGVWSETLKILAPLDSDEGARFGYSVAINGPGDVILISCYLRSDTYINDGVVYVYTATEGVWSQQVKLVASDAATTDRFGVSVALSDDGNIIAVSAIYDDDYGSSSGSVYIYVRSGGVWLETVKLTDSRSTGSYMGYQVSLDALGITVAAGAYSDNEANSSAGALYVFK